MRICSPLSIETPFPTAFIFCARSFIKQLNRSRESGHPWRKPTVTSNQSVVSPLIRTQDDTDWYNDWTDLNILPLMPICVSLFHKRVWFIESYAFLKSMKAAKVLNLSFCLVSIKLVKLLTWSIVHRVFLKPFCSSTKTSLRLIHLLNLSFKIEQYNLYVAGAKVIPLYESGSLGSAVFDFGIGFIIPLPQLDGTQPESKQTLNKICKQETETVYHYERHHKVIHLFQMLFHVLHWKLPYVHLKRKFHHQILAHVLF